MLGIKNGLKVNSWGGKLWKFSASAFLMQFNVYIKNNWKYVILDILNKPIDKLAIYIFN